MCPCNTIIHDSWFIVFYKLEYTTHWDTSKQVLLFWLNGSERKIFKDFQCKSQTSYCRHTLNLEISLDKLELILRVNLSTHLVQDFRVKCFWEDFKKSLYLFLFKLNISSLQPNSVPNIMVRILKLHFMYLQMLPHKSKYSSKMFLSR